MINRKTVNRIKRMVFRKFPEFKGINPKILERKVKPQSAIYRKLSLGTPKILRKVFRLKFEKKVTTVDEVEIDRILTVTLNEAGEIIKITESR